jgi:hypothetical protein
MTEFGRSAEPFGDRSRDTHAPAAMAAAVTRPVSFPASATVKPGE